MSDDTTATNDDQRRVWAIEGEQWVRDADRYDEMNGRFGAAMLEAAGLEPGDRVLDVGCGNGATSIEAARRVTPGGSVVGVDLSAEMLALARRRASEAGLDGVEFVEADAQVHPFDTGSFDVVISRFGNMFFGDPVAAFTNLHAALRPGGRLALVCWQDIFHCEWILVPAGAAAEHVGLPDMGPPGAPGPFAFADDDRLREIVDVAGFSDITIHGVTEPMRIGDDPDDAVAFITSMRTVRDDLFGGKPEDTVRAAVDAARQALEPYQTDDGVVLSGGAWLLTARR